MECSYTEFWCYLASTRVMSQNLEPPWKTTPNCLAAPKGSTCVTRPAIFGCFRVSVFPTHFETIISRMSTPDQSIPTIHCGRYSLPPKKTDKSNTYQKSCSIAGVYIYWLVVSIPLKNMSSSLGMMKFPI